MLPSGSSRNPPDRRPRGAPNRGPPNPRTREAANIIRIDPMAWVILVRTLFVLAVTYAAFVTRPFSTILIVNLVAGAALGIVMLLIESRLRSAEVTDLLGALIGGALRPRPAQTHGGARVRPRAGQDDRCRAVLGGHHRSAGDVPSQLHPPGLSLHRHRHGGPQGRVA